MSGLSSPMRDWPGAQPGHFGLGRLLDLHDAIGLGVQLGRRDDRRACVFVGRVREGGGGPGAVLDEDFDARGLELAEGFRHQRHAALAGQGFSRNADSHGGSCGWGMIHRISCGPVDCGRVMA